MIHLCIVGLMGFWGRAGGILDCGSIFNEILELWSADCKDWWNVDCLMYYY